MYSISLKLGSDEYTSKGETAQEALVALKRPNKLMMKGVLTITDGVKKREVLMYPQRLKRLFYNKTFQGIQAKVLTAGMK